MNAQNDDEQPLTSLDQLVPKPDIYMMRHKIYEKPESERVAELLRSSQRGCIVVSSIIKTVLPVVEYYAQSHSEEGGIVQASLPNVKIRLYASIGSIQRQISEEDEELLSEFLQGIGYADKTIYPQSEYDRVESRIFTLSGLD